MIISVLWTSLGKKKIKHGMIDFTYMPNRFFNKQMSVLKPSHLYEHKYLKSEDMLFPRSKPLPLNLHLHRQYKILSACFLFHTNKNLRTVPRFILQFLDYRMRKN